MWVHPPSAFYPVAFSHRCNSQATADDGQSAAVAISDVGGGRRHAIRSPNEGVAALTHAAETEEEDASTRALDFDPQMMRVVYAAGLSMLYVLVFGERSGGRGHDAVG